MSNLPIDSCIYSSHRVLAMRPWKNIFLEIHSPCLSFPRWLLCGLINLKALQQRQPRVVADKMGSDLTEYLKRVRYSKAAVQNHGCWGTQTGSGHVNQRLPSCFPQAAFISSQRFPPCQWRGCSGESSPRGQVAFQNRLAKYLKSQSRSQPCLILLCQQLSFVRYSCTFAGAAWWAARPRH